MTIIVAFKQHGESTLPVLQRAKLDPAVCILPLLQHRIPG
jgi:DNA polymerase V